MNWNDPKVFLAIVNQGSLSGAAKLLGQNHSTVFRRLNELEANLATRLFDRLPQGYVLTGAGERMAELAQQADANIQAIQRELTGRDLAASGKVKVTAPANLAQTILPEVIQNLLNTHPDILIELTVSDSDFDLNKREADLALRATNKPPEHLIGKKLVELDWALCGNPKFWPSQIDSPKGLANMPIIGADTVMLRLPSFRWLENQFGGNIVTRANSLNTMAALAEQGIGLAALPSDQINTGLVRCFTIPDITGEIWLLSHPDLHQTSRVKTVWRELERVVKKVIPVLT